MRHQRPLLYFVGRAVSVEVRGVGDRGEDSELCSELNKCSHNYRMSIEKCRPVNVMLMCNLVYFFSYLAM